MDKVMARRVLRLAFEVLVTEAESVKSIRLGKDFLVALSLLHSCTGKIVVSGMGKVGHVGQRFAATLASTGTPAIFLHPAEAAHGDLGTISPNDILVVLSNSGHTREVLEMVAGARALHPELIRIVVSGNRNSPLFSEGTVSLCYGKIKEPCPLGLTPTASIAAVSALLDALTLALMQLRGFTVEDYSRRHHAGYLGKKARQQVALQKYGGDGR